MMKEPGEEIEGPAEQKVTARWSWREFGAAEDKIENQCGENIVRIGSGEGRHGQGSKKSKIGTDYERFYRSEYGILLF